MKELNQHYLIFLIILFLAKTYYNINFFLFQKSNVNYSKFQINSNIKLRDI